MEEFDDKKKYSILYARPINIVHGNFFFYFYIRKYLQASVFDMV